LSYFHDLQLYHTEWNLSNLTHQGTREMCQIVQDVGILRFYLTEILCDHKFLLDVTGCRKTEVSDYTNSTVLYPLIFWGNQRFKFINCTV